MAHSEYSIHRRDYPDPFLDVASTKLPKSRRKLLELCFIFATTHPQISPIIKKLSKYPITRVIIDNDKSDSDSLRVKWKEAFEEELDIYAKAESIGLDFFGYGNCFITVHKPFERSYNCKSCGYAHQAGEINYYVHNEEFRGKCKKCEQKVELEPEDHNTKVIEDIEVVRLKPQNIFVRYNELTGKESFYYDIPDQLKHAIDSNNPDRETIDETPTPYLEAAVQDKKIKFKKGKVLHLREPSMSGRGMEWGNPIILAGLKDAYLNQVYKKADESLANERAIPARFVYPETNTESPLRRISLAKFSSYLSDSIRRWRQDKNAVMPSPFPVGTSEVGGDAHRFSNADMRKLAVKEIIGSTGVPEGFLADGMTWSGGSVQLRMLQNMLMSYVRSQNKMLKFVMREVAAIKGWPEVGVRFKPFKMADDMQKLQILTQLAQMKVVSYKEILERLDLDWDEQHEHVRKETEQLQDVHIQEQLLEAKTQLQAAGIQAETQMQQQNYGDIVSDITEDHQAAMSHFKREGSYHEVEEQQEKQKKKEQKKKQQMKERKRQAEISKAEAEAMKDKAKAEQKGVHADMAEKSLSQDVPQIIESTAEKLMQLTQPKRGEKLEKLKKDSPNLASKVEERLHEMEQRERTQEKQKEEKQQQKGREKFQKQQQQKKQQAQKQKAMAQAEKVTRELRRASKSPEEFANEFSMLEPDLRAKIQSYLREKDPQLLVKVMQAMSPSGGSKSEPSSQKVNMDALPEQKPSGRTQ